MIYAVLDIESTGGGFNEEGIMEIAIYRFDGERIVDSFESLINPQKEIQAFVSKLTGIKSGMLVNAPLFSEVAQRISEITDNAILVAHNARFDYRLLRTEFRRIGIPFERRSLCTVELSQALLPDAPSHSLGKLVRHLGIAVNDRHRANGDALATLELLKYMIRLDGSQPQIESLIRTGETGELSNRQLELVEALPSETGIYYLLDKDGETLFVKKSHNIRVGVTKQLIKNDPTARKLQKSTRSVEFEVTGSYLYATILEQEAYRARKPRFLSKSRLVNGFSHGVYVKGKANGNLELAAEKSNGQSQRLSSFSSYKSSTNFLQKIKKQIDLKGSGEHEDQKQKIEDMISRYSLDNRDMLLVDRGRGQNDQCVFRIKQGKLESVGFLERGFQKSELASIEGKGIGNNADRNIFIIESFLRKAHRLSIIEMDQFN